MLMAFFDILAFGAVIVWPVIPLFWIPVHGLSRFFKKLGVLSYLVPAVAWTPLAIFIFSRRDFILSWKTQLPFAAAASGGLLFIAGVALQLWSGRFLSLKGLMGLPEVSSKVESRFVTTGPYVFVRHPTYLSHTLMFLGLSLLTGINAMGIVTLLDFLLINLAVIPLEDRELIVRFGPVYEEYRKKVPAFFPLTLFGRGRSSRR